MLELEVKTYEEKLPELLKTDTGRFVLIKEQNVVGTFAAIEDALQSGYEKFKNTPFFVRQILPVQQTLNFTYNHFFN